MYVFNYDPATFAYTGGTRADFCQLEPGKILAPAWSSKNPPPKHDTAVSWAYYVPKTDGWEIRPLPPAPAVQEPAIDERFAAEQAELRAHLEAVQRLIKERAAEAEKKAGA